MANGFEHFDRVDFIELARELAVVLQADYDAIAETSCRDALNREVALLR